MTETIMSDDNVIVAPSISMLFKNDNHYFTFQNDWVDLGEDLDLINGFEQGIPAGESVPIDQLSYFDGPIEVLVFSDTEDSELSMVVEYFVDSDVEQVASDIDVISNVAEEMTLENNSAILIEGLNIVDATDESANFSIDVDSNVAEEMTLENDSSILIEGLNTIDNESVDAALEISSQKEHEDGIQQELSLIGETTSQLRTAISLDNGESWSVFDQDLDDWKQIDIQNIDLEGMPIDLLNSLDYFDYEKLAPNRIYLKDLLIATQLSSTIEDKETIFQGLEVEYYENQPAFIKNATLTPDTIHNEYATLSFDLVDLEGDDVFYKILVKRAEEEAYTQIDPNPLNREWNKRGPEGSVNHAYNHPYFNKGLNKIKVIVKDSRDATSENELDLFLLDEKPWIQVSHNQFGMNLSVGDDMMDSVSCRVSINNNIVIDYTDFQPSPISFKYLWRPGELKQDELNTVKIEVIDSFGSMSTEEFEIEGRSTNIMFADNLGDHLTDNLGDLIKHLDFGAIVGGTVSEPKVVKVINETGSAINNLEIGILSDQIADGVSVQLSKEIMPFNEDDRIKYSGVVPFQDEREFYVRIKSSKRTEGIHGFEAVASSNTEI